MRIAIDNPIRNISPDIHSHRSAWAYIWREMLLQDGYECEVLHDEAPWDGFDAVYTYCGMEFNGTPNMFDGLNDKVFRRMDRYVQNHRRLTYRLSEAEIGEIFFRRLRVRERNKNKTTTPLATAEWMDRLQDALLGLPKITPHDLRPRTALVIGDSHTRACWRKDAYIKRMDGRTLRSLSVKLPELASEFTDRYDIRSMTVCAGNIDIRHHVMREHRDGDGRVLSPEEYLDDTLARYERTLISMSARIPDIEVVHAYPVEHESRHLRKSVCLEDMPFYGTWTDRTRMMHRLNAGLSAMAARNGWRVLEWPREWYVNTELDPRWFFNRMERPYSVHLSREFYRWRATPTETDDGVFG